MYQMLVRLTFDCESQATFGKASHRIGDQKLYYFYYVVYLNGCNPKAASVYEDLDESARSERCV
jgi:hypothetical protein